MKKKIIIITAVVAVIGVFVAIGISKGKNNNKISVKTSKVAKGDVQSYLSTTGIVKSKNKKEYFGTQGKVNKVSVKVGDKVKKGQVLLSFNIPDLQNAKEQAELQYQNAILQKEELLSQKKSIEDKIYSIDKNINKLKNSKNPNNLAKVEALKQQKETIQPINNEKISQVENSVRLAQLAVDSANNKINETGDKIISDIDGVVTEVNISDGGVSSGTQPLVVVQNIDDLKVGVSLGKYDATKVKKDMKVFVKNDNKKYEGKVDFIAPTAKKVTTPTGGDNASTLECEVYLSKEDVKDLRIGFDVDVDILLGQSKNVIKVPMESIKTNKYNKSYVYVVKEGKVKEKAVVLGTQSDMEAEIKSGLKEGEKIVLNPNNSIKDGITVQEK